MHKLTQGKTVKAHQEPFATAISGVAGAAVMINQCLLCLSLVACGGGLVLLYVLLQCSARATYAVLPDLT